MLILTSFIRGLNSKKANKEGIITIENETELGNQPIPNRTHKYTFIYSNRERISIENSFSDCHNLVSSLN